jgi:PAS domain S-box-containing protein
MRNQKSHELAHAEQDWLRVTLSSIGDAVITTDTSGRVTFLNPVAQSLTGWTLDEASGVPLDTVFNIVNEETHRTVENPATRALRDGLVVGLANHTLLVAKDGTERPIDDSAAPIRNTKGEVAGVVLVFRDVTERRKAERALRESDERFHLLVEGTKDYAIFMLDPHGYVLTWNQGAQRLKGYTPEEIIGQHFSRFYAQDVVERGWPAHELNVAATKGRFEDEGWRVRKDGSHFWANVVITALHDDAGKLRGFSKVTRDLTERSQAEENTRRLLLEEVARKAAQTSAEEARKAEAAERAQREQLRVTLASIGDAILVTDARGRVTLMNPVAEALTGWKQADALGLPLEQIFTIVNELTGQPAENPVVRVLREGVVAGLANHTVLIAKDGMRRPIDDSAAPIKNEHGNVDGVVLVFRDVTERRRAEAQLQRQHEELAAATRQKDQFLAVLAHELRNPLAPLRNALQIVKLRDDSPQAVSQVRELMERQLSHLVRLVDDLLDVNRITRGKIELRSQRVSLAAVVQSAVEASGPLIEAGKHQLTITMAQKALYVVGDSARLAQVVSNLLNNAAKYTPAEGHIWLTAEQQDGEAVIRVKDTGIGIPAEMLAPVFEMFMQVECTSERSQGGLGIGLMLVKRLVEMHGGTVQACSEGPGRGSEFTVRLPLIAIEKRRAEGGIRPVSEGPSRRILVVDDNVDSAESLAVILRLSGHEVRTAHDGPSAINLAATFMPDVALLDIGMPGLNGHDTGRRVRELQGLEKIVLIAVTGFGQGEDRQRTAEAGFHTHLVKPVDPAALQEVLASLVTG